MTIYHDALHQLVKPVFSKLPKSKVKRKEVASNLRVVARQELVWAASAHLEGVSELTRSKKLKKKNPELARELFWDSKVAFDFEKIRKRRAREIMELAKRLLE